jgi:aldehyde:ferredoxin oxidoreductase
MNGVCAGRWLSVDLENREVREEEIAEEDARTWLLGSGLAARLFHGRMDGRTNGRTFNVRNVREVEA